MTDAVIVSAVRSPIGRAYKGSLASVRADDLATAMIGEALARIPEFDPNNLDDLMLGCAQPAGQQGYNLARMISIQLGLDTVPGTTVNRYCASSVQAIRMAFHAIRAGEGHAFVAAGVESVSNFSFGKSDGMPDTHNPIYAEAEQRTADRAASGSAWTDPRESGERPDAYISMGQTAENIAQAYNVSREAQDAFAARSQQLAVAAAERGFWEREITPVTLADGTVVTADDGPRPGVTVESLASLNPVFRESGTVTAGNCCALNDGAAALVIMSSTRAKELGLVPLARIVSTGVSALSPEIMGLGPVEATRRALANANMTIDQIDQLEVNEAFAAQAIPSIEMIGINPDRVNVNGGAIALGHPFGMTGVRIATTLLHSLEERDERFGLETMCTAGGQGMALILERLS